jgi:anti-sigma B factor antagonist
MSGFPRELDFEVTAEVLDETTSVIRLTGESDMHSAAEFKRVLFAVVAREPADVIVDLTTTTFFDSTNLGVLLSGVKRVREYGGRIAIVSADRNVTSVFEISGLDRVFALYPTLVAARRRPVADDGRSGAVDAAGQLAVQ